ncbi:putative mfs monocarboxylate transporter protein [Botrytis fragariae]|uniref:Putative mfs monocarboxylate transporter protein n=1 Tax=Botrytis fragariae TaxID=1964551 RepID=A0A8H6APY1_9HELO|nr:putative mfs monocarboxylate transporter protein [Botrytis fragariae]KAF5871646.1 putative mfs monocarboxylate transporter protein [Botrytis fragariae]
MTSDDGSEQQPVAEQTQSLPVNRNAISTTEKSKVDGHHHEDLPPPNGGLVAWTQVTGAFFLFFNTWGIVNTFGVYQTYYQLDMLASESSSNIAWIGSFQGFLLFLGSAVTGPFFDMGYLRMLLSLGFGMLFLLSVAIVSQYFSTKRAFAFGIAASGSSLGGVFYTLIFRALQPRVGFGWATRIIAFIMLVTLVIPVLGMKLRGESSTTRRDFLDLTAFKAKPYLAFCLSDFFGFMSIYVTFFYIQLYAEEQVSISSLLASYLLTITNAASTIGRLIPNFFADKIGPLIILIPFALVVTVLCFGWIGITSEAGIVVFCFLYGFFCGAFVSLPGIIVITISPNLKTIGIQLGMALSISGFGMLIGEPIAGAILDANSGWKGLQAFCGAMILLSGAFALLARLYRTGPILMAKA